MPVLRYRIDDQNAATEYRVFCNTELTEADATYLINYSLFEHARHTRLHPQYRKMYQFVQITAPDGWKKPKYSRRKHPR
jgi:hypothetical protein